MEEGITARQMVRRRSFGFSLICTGRGCTGGEATRRAGWEGRRVKKEGIETEDGEMI